MVKIGNYHLRRAGASGTIVLPKVWINDLKIQLGDPIDIYRDEMDRLILMPRKNQS